MKNYIYTILTIFFLWIGGTLISCDDYLDVESYFDDIMPLDSIFKRKEYLEEYITGAGALLPKEGDLWTNAWAPYQGASDENFSSWNDNRHAAIRLLLDEVTPTSAFYNNYGTWYQGIRKANLVLERINECEDISTTDLRDFMGRCYFLRAYFYYKLVEAYGPVPIVPEKTFGADDDVETMSIERDTYDDCIAYICDNFEKAAGYLFATRSSSAEINLPTSGAALAFLARVRLTAASRWYNGNAFYADWKRSDDRHFISQANDNSKWALAAIAAKRVIYDTGTKYSLYTASRESNTIALPAAVSPLNFPDGAGNIDPFRSYAYIFNGEVSAANNPEYIYICNYSNTYGDSPAWISTPVQLGGGNGLNITYATVKAFRMLDGRDINNSSAEYPYPSSDYWAEIGGSNKSFSGYTLRSTAPKMFDNMEMRFYVNVGFNHSFWPGTSYTGTAGLANQEITYYSNGTAMPSTSFPDDYNHTGFTCKKYIHYLEDHIKGVMKTKVFPIMRYAEVLLNYVEALNELEQTYTDEATGHTVSRDLPEMVKYFNMIRYRAGLPGVSESDAEVRDRDAMRELIKRERRVEFFCEGRRYHDLRRWGDAMAAYNEPVTGMNISARSSERQKFHTETVINNSLSHRVFAYKMYFLPIPRSVMNKNAKLVQNPGW